MTKCGRPSVGQRSTWKEYYICKFDELAQYSKQLGWNVMLRKGTTALNEADFEKKQITINSSQRPELRVYTLLHELGHASVRRGQGWAYKFPYCNLNKKVLTTNRERIGILEEEMAAWHKALDIAKKRNVIIDREVFDRDKARCLMTYIKWVRKEPGW